MKTIRAMTPLQGSSPQALRTSLKAGVAAIAGLAAATGCSSVAPATLSTSYRALSSEDSPVVVADQPVVANQPAVAGAAAGPAVQQGAPAALDAVKLGEPSPHVLAFGPNPFEHADVDLSSKGMVITSDDGETTYRIGGRIQVDVSAHSEDQRGGDEITDGTELRRGRFFIAGKQREGWLWTGEVDFGNNATSVKDFWLAHEDADKLRFTVGHQKQPFSLGVEMSSNDLSFVERGIDNFLIIPFVDRAIGVRVDSPTENSLFTAGIYGEGLAEPNSSAMEDEGFGATIRYVYAPIIEDEEVLHLGIRGAIRTPSSDNTVRIRDESTNASNLRIVDTGLITNVEETLLYGFESSYASGPWSTTLEYNLVDIGRDGEDLGFNSWHIEGTYSLTGESRAGAYKVAAGEYKRLKQAKTGQSPFAGGGAWEIATRYAALDVSDGFVDAGETDAFTLALNWYANTNVRFMLDWTRILSTDGGDAVTEASEDLDIFTLRAQLLF